ncbi:MAG: helix-turn-helix transcriptional regulator [Lachnospiraceae bacterium]|nr:helix-turn-helix transcriptional regulator [Lachnospiraceae bacterium]MDY4892799.1 helix-turn-helix transcriptional regulator [Agathobacter sp.]
MKAEDKKYIIFGERLSQTMYKKNISNIQLAEMLYVSPSTVSGYRTGRRSPSVNELAEIGQILDVSVDFLIGNSDTEKK